MRLNSRSLFVTSTHWLDKDDRDGPWDDRDGPWNVIDINTVNTLHGHFQSLKCAFLPQKWLFKEQSYFFMTVDQS